ncbi:glycosyltransferase family protein [Ramlibacter alkalitolerans]|uniref:ADP-heptose--LPS heptosyltransferase n=1 Tax=Ramlibacter alkalitolerans TaxID=2039631 RepID=A0ABS1JRR9_9BURK|nr:hypothetical protein [Ramlibacter alkalitolerans]MBL0426947.1 hypothetical protein [Ramlibacter alkalitolerans]
MSGAATPDIAGDWFAAMRRGDWEAAWRATDRIELPRRVAQRAPGFVRGENHLRWDGTPPANRTVLVRCEHGLGDTLQFMRFLPLLRAAQLHFMVQPQLLRLLQGVAGLGDVRNYWTDDPLPPHDVDVEVMELPYALRMTLARLPPPPAQLRERLPRPAGLPLRDEGRLRVGLLWAASDWDASRTVPLPALAPLFALEEVQFFSLQQGEAARDPLLQRLPIACLSAQTTQVEVAAAAMCALDLVISVDGMPAHLAGTLGCPTWVLLKREADWRWMEAREDTPWYPTMRLFRQPRAGDWAAVGERVAAALQEVAAGRRHQASRQQVGWW